MKPGTSGHVLYIISILIPGYREVLRLQREPPRDPISNPKGDPAPQPADLPEAEPSIYSIEVL